MNLFPSLLYVLDFPRRKQLLEQVVSEANCEHFSLQLIHHIAAAEFT